ncbi:NAD(P)-binding protein [Mycena galericulata]|nr:NAD(P)-binding protein [Mycena galericulata]
MASVYSMIRRVYTMMNPPTAAPRPVSKPIKFGIFGAAAIAPDAILTPAKSHPEGVVYAVAARDRNRAKQFAKRHGIPKLPAGLHYEWTMKALAAGKHVLVEKPSSCTAEETRRMFELAETKGLVLLDALHNQYAMLNFMLTIGDKVHRVKDIVASGELGAVKSTYTSLGLNQGYMKPDDIRFNYELGGGALMDMGCYTISAMRFFTGTDPTEVLSVEHELKAPKVDRNTTAKLALPGGATTATLACRTTSVMDAVIECESGRIEVKNYIMPTLYHSITVTPTGRKRRVEKAYTFPDLGQPRWTTYHYQLETFKGRKTHAWITKEYSVKNMEVIESIYAKKGGNPTSLE